MLYANVVIVAHALAPLSAMTDNIGASTTPLDQFTVDGNDGTPSYDFSCKGIAWPTDAKKYDATTYDLSQVAPPRDWIGKSYNGQTLDVGKSWSQQTKKFNPTEDEHFQVGQPGERLHRVGLVL